jgi:hypothetical protein
MDSCIPKEEEEVMIFFEKNKVLGVEPNRVLNQRVPNFLFLLVALSLCVRGVGYSGEFLTKTTVAPSQEVVEGRS